MGSQCAELGYSIPSGGTDWLLWELGWLFPATRHRSKLISSRCLIQSVIRASSGPRATDKQGESSSEAEMSKRIKSKKFMRLSTGIGVALFTGLVMG